MSHVILLETSLRKVNHYLKHSGLYFIEENSHKRLLPRLYSRWFLFISLGLLSCNYSTVVAWFIHGISAGQSLVELTYPAACSTHCLIGIVKAFFFFTYEEYVNNIVDILRYLNTVSKVHGEGTDDLQKKMFKRMSVMTRISKVVYSINLTAITAFVTIPFIRMTRIYLSTGEIELIMPSLVLYPFEVNDIRIWSLACMFQIFTVSISIFMVFGPDSFYYLSCTFIQMQFWILQHDTMKVVTRNLKETNYGVKDTFWSDFYLLVKRHKEIMRCITLIECVYSKSSFVNVVTSSFLLCLTGFYITSNDDPIKMIPFVPLLFNSLLQIFWLCYFGDMITQSSLDFSDAVYGSQWYNADISAAKDLLFVLTKAQSPCKLTAYGFTDLNLQTFMRILNTTYTYFTLLKTVNAN